MFDPHNAAHVANLNASRYLLRRMSDVEIQGNFKLSDMDLDTCNRPLWLERLKPIVSDLLRLGWITQERATPRSAEERQQTLCSIYELLRQARAIIAIAEEPYVWNGVTFAATGPGASL